MTGLRGPLLLALGLRVLLLMILANGEHHGQVLTSDSLSYLEPTASLARGDGFGVDGVPEVSRTPGYPLALVPGHWVGQPVRWALVLQVLCGLALVAGTARMVRGLGHGERAVRLAAWLAAVEPLWLLYGAQVLTETLFTTIFVWMLAWRVEGRIRIAALAGAFLPLVRPVGLVLAPLCAAVELSRRGPDSRRKALLWIVPWLVCFSGWTLRNADAGVREFSTIGTATLFNYYAAGVSADVSGRPFLDVRDEMRAAIPPGTSAERHEHMRRTAWTIISEHPGVFAVNWAKGWVRTVLDPESTGWARLFGAHDGGLLVRSQESGLFALLDELRRDRPLLFWMTVLLGAMLGGLWIAAGRGILRGGWPPLLWVPALALLVLSGGTNAHGRFRHPLMPLIIVAAAPVLAGLKRSET